MNSWQGSIEDCLNSGELDSGDYCIVPYDELADLVEQGRLAMDMILGREAIPVYDRRDKIERKTNRPLHPLLGGDSPYSGFLPLGETG